MKNFTCMFKYVQRSMGRDWLIERNKCVERRMLGCDIRSSCSHASMHDRKLKVYAWSICICTWATIC